MIDVDQANDAVYLSGFDGKADLSENLRISEDAATAGAAAARSSSPSPPRER